MVVEAYNGFEAALWAVLAIIVAIRYRHAVAGLRRTGAITSVLLVMFAISDVIEMYTGAWWKPWSLMLLKVFCLVGLIWCARQLIRGSPASKKDL